MLNNSPVFFFHWYCLYPAPPAVLFSQQLSTFSTLFPPPLKPPIESLTVYAVRVSTQVCGCRTLLFAICCRKKKLPRTQTTVQRTRWVCSCAARLIDTQRSLLCLSHCRIVQTILTLSPHPISQRRSVTCRWTSQCYWGHRLIPFSSLHVFFHRLKALVSTGGRSVQAACDW